MLLGLPWPISHSIEVKYGSHSFIFQLSIWESWYVYLCIVIVWNVFSSQHTMLEFYQAEDWIQGDCIQLFLHLQLCTTSLSWILLCQIFPVCYTHTMENHLKQGLKLNKHSQVLWAAKALRSFLCFFDRYISSINPTINHFYAGVCLPLNPKFSSDRLEYLEQFVWCLLYLLFLSCFCSWKETCFHLK